MTHCRLVYWPRTHYLYNRHYKVAYRRHIYADDYKLLLSTILILYYTRMKLSRIDNDIDHHGKLNDECLAI